MKAVAIDQYGGKELLKVRDVPVPEVGPGELLIKVESAGVGVWDAMVRSGVMDAVAPATFPLVLGADGAGTVAAVGADVQEFQVGDRVYAYSFLNPKGGFYAEYVALPPGQVAPVPTNLSTEEAALLAVPGLTALHGLTDALGVKAEDRLLIYGVGAVGFAALQLAKRLGARVLAVASGAESVAAAQRAGADAVVDGRGGDVAAAIREFAPGGLDAVLATISVPGLDAAIAAVRQGGRVAYPQGVMPVPQGRPGVEAVGYNGTPDRQTFDALNRLVEMKPFTILIDQTFPLAEAAQAAAAMEGRHLGRMVLRAAA